MISEIRKRNATDGLTVINIMRIEILSVTLEGARASAVVLVGDATPGAPHILEENPRAQLVAQQLRVVIRAASLPPAQGPALEVQRIWRDFFRAEARKLLLT